MSNTQDELRKLVDMEVEERLNAFADTDIPATYRTSSGKDIHNQASAEAYKDNAVKEILDELGKQLNTLQQHFTLLNESVVMWTDIESMYAQLLAERTNLKREEK